MKTNNLRILLVVDSLDVGGAERHVIDLATALAVRGHEVEIACSVLAGDGLGLSAGSIPVHALLNNGVRRRLSLSYARELRRLLAEKPPDLVHAHVFASAAASAAALATSPIPLVVTEHSEPRWQEAPARRIRRGYLRRAGHVIAASERIAWGCRNEAGLCAEGLSIIPCAVSPPPSPSHPNRYPAQGGRDRWSASWLGWCRRKEGIS